MEEMTYLRIFGVPEIDNVNRARYKMMHCEIIEDTDCSGEKLTELFKHNKKALVFNNTTFANMLMCTINIKELNKYNIDDMFHVISNNCERLKRFLSLLMIMIPPKHIDYANLRAVSLGEDIEALILSKDD